MNITSISHRPIRAGGSLMAALLAAGLQLSLVAFPIGSLRAGGENEERNAFTSRNLQSDIAGVAERTDPNLVNSSWSSTRQRKSFGLLTMVPACPRFTVLTELPSCWGNPARIS